MDVYLKEIFELSWLNLIKFILDNYAENRFLYLLEEDLLKNSIEPGKLSVKKEILKKSNSIELQVKRPIKPIELHKKVKEEKRR